MKDQQSKKHLKLFFVIVIFGIIIYLIVKYFLSEKFTNINVYEKKRNKWLNKNKAMSLSSKEDFALNDIEKKVNEKWKSLLVSYLKLYDPQKIDNNGINKVPKEKFPPHSYFPSVKHLYEDSGDLFKFLDSMPKGGLLHIHSGAVGNLDWILNEGIFITGLDGTKCWINKKIVDNIDPYEKGDDFLFKFSINKPEDSSNIWIPVTKDYILLNKNAIKERLVMSDILSNKESPEVWSVFETINNRYASLREYIPYSVASWKNGLETLASNNIQHADIRFGFGGPTPDGGPINIKSFLNKTIDKLNTFIKAYNQMKYNYPDFTIKIILSTPRIVNVDTLQQIVDCAYMLKSGKYLPDNMTVSDEIKNIITGYDLIAEEDPNYPTNYYIKVWIKQSEREKKYGVKLPFFFHDGESDWVMNQNVVDAVLLDAKRIGHGFNIAFFPYIKKELIKRKICLEVCPISNQILQYFRDLRVHSANSLFKEGVPMVISTDDPLMFGYNGLTYDFWVASISWGLDLKDIKCLVYNSITYSSLTDIEKNKSLKELDNKWNIWIDNWNKKGIFSL